MENRLCALYRELEILLNLSPAVEDCTDALNEVYSDMANLYNSLTNAGLQELLRSDTCGGSKAPDWQELLTPGDLIYCVESDEYCGLLYVASCNDYVLACPEEWSCEGDFEQQLEKMCEEQADGFSSDIHIYSKNCVFQTPEEAEQYLEQEDAKHE